MDCRIKTLFISQQENRGGMLNICVSLLPERLQIRFLLLSEALLPAILLEVHRFSEFLRCMCRRGSVLGHLLGRFFQFLCIEKRRCRRFGLAF